LSLFERIGKFQLEPRLASAYGVVLYTEAHPFVHKLVADNVYCKALNAISGDRWVLFASRAKAGRFGYPKFGPDQMGMMVMMWHEPAENRQLLEELQIESTENLPCLLVLFPDSNGEAFVHTIKIEGKSEAETFESLSQSVKAITQAIKDVSDDNLKNAEGVHAAVGLRLQTLKQWNMVRKALPFIRLVRVAF